MIALLAAAFLLTPSAGFGQLTLAQIRSDPNLTPARFMEYFKNFQFRLSEKLQSPEAFLEARSGDCDDFATLAADVLREKHYTTQLIAVFMQGQTHIVCYVVEAGGYLDFNCRNQGSTIQPTNGKIEDVADKVAAYFRTTWRYAAELSYRGGVARLGRITFLPTEPVLQKIGG